MSRPRRGKARATAGRRTLAGLACALAVPLAACGAPDGRAALCARVIPALDPEAAAPAIVREGGGGDRVRLTYRAAGAADGDPSRRIECRFGGADGATLTGVRLAGAAANDGALSPAGLFLLREYWLKRGGGVPATPAGGPPPPALVGVQQAINATTLAAIYGMLGAGYGLVWALLGRVNLAFGELAAVGGFAAFTTAALLALIGPLALPLALPPALLTALIVGGAYGLAVERVVFRPLAGAAARAPLIATAGLILVFSEFLRLAQGADDRWLPPWFEAVPLAGGAGFVPTVNVGQGLVLVLSAGTGVALVLLVRRTGFGRRFRACCDDPGMAALCGVDPARTAALTFALAGASAGAAGFVFLAYYGGIGFSTGVAIGFKALTAAVIGGLGSVPGAFLGGAVVGGLEVFWTAALGADFRDVAVFALLAAFLVWRPEGLAGTRPTPEER